MCVFRGVSVRSVLQGDMFVSSILLRDRTVDMDSSGEGEGAMAYELTSQGRRDRHKCHGLPVLHVQSV